MICYLNSKFVQNTRILLDKLILEIFLLVLPCKTCVYYMLLLSSVCCKSFIWFLFFWKIFNYFSINKLVYKCELRVYLQLYTIRKSFI